MSYVFKMAGSSRYLLLGLVIAGCTSEPPKKIIHKKYAIEIRQMKFQPAELFVHAGDTVVFINHDLVMHDITEETSKSWTSGALPVDSAWSMETGVSSNYYCSIHPDMKGKITVQ